MKTDLNRYDNSWYSTGGGFLKRIIWYYVNIFLFINPLNPISSLKVACLRIFGAKIGRGVRINPSVNIKYPWLLEVGDHTWIGEGVWIDNLSKVKIRSHCCLSQRAVLLTGNHDYKKSTFDLIVEEITLEDGVWLGAGSMICPGVTCKNHSVLGVQSVATRNLESFVIYHGNPAQPVRKRQILM